MLDLEDSNFKLLKMKEKLLGITDSNKEANLLDYEETAKKIDEVYFDNLISEIEKSNDDNLSLEEEVKFLSNIKDMYEQLEFMQHKFRNVYQKYSDNMLVLNDLNRVNIDIINERIDTINGYLISLKNINKTKLELQSLSEQLVSEEKKKTVVENRILEYEDELKNNFLNAEGRKLFEDGIKYTSILKEYQDNEIDLEKVFENKKLLDEIFDKFNLDRKEKEEMLSTAMVCYDNNPNKESKEILDAIRIDTERARYKLSLVKIVKLVVEYKNDCDGARKKREEIIDLIKYRSSYLEKLGIRFSIDPFSRIKINSQLDAIIELGSNSRLISNLRKKINNFTSKLEELDNKNSELLIKINSKKEILNDTLSMSSIDVSSVELKSEEIVKIADNQVVSIEILPDNFMLDRAIEKTTGVINRVNEMINGYEKIIIEKNNDDVVPDLVIEECESEKEALTSSPVNVLEMMVDNSFDNIEPIQPLDLDDSNHNDEESIASLSEDKTEDSLFTEVVPFEDVSLFSDRYDEELNGNEIFIDNLSDTDDDNITKNNDVNLEISDDAMIDSLVSEIDNNNGMTLNDDDSLIEEQFLEPEMPDLFWVTPEEDTRDEKIISLDEQISNLLAEGKDTKTKKLVA